MTANITFSVCVCVCVCVGGGGGGGGKRSRSGRKLDSSSSSSIERSGFFEKNVQLTSKGERYSHLLPRLKTIKSLLKTVCVEH